MAAQPIRLAAAIDVHIAGLETELQHDEASSFARPILARSMCIQRVRSLKRGACPRFRQIFPRIVGGNLLPHYFDDGPRAAEYDCLREVMPADHPCKPLSRRDCREAFVLALGSYMGS